VHPRAGGALVSATLLASHADASAYHATWADLLPVVAAAGGCDAVIVDAPYSERTHGGQRHDRREYDEARGWASARGIVYDHWTADDVAAFVGAWAPLTRGWMVSLTDHSLARAWEASLREAGRYVFAPLPAVQVGMNCRLAGDGPSSWTCWAVVARPKGEPYSKWGTLRGAYVGNAFDAGENTATASRRSLVIGGKPRWLMEALVRDYTRPGDLVADPCMGAGTTLVACQRTGRRAIGGDAMLAHAQLAAERISRPAQQPLWLAEGGQ